MADDKQRALAGLEWRELPSGGAWHYYHHEPAAKLFYSLLVMETETSGGWFGIMGVRGPLGDANLRTPPCLTAGDARFATERRLGLLLQALGAGE